jgi:SAM-dependent methyltransferase
MDAQTAKILCEITSDFYREQNESFSKTRKAPWPGWKRSLALVQDACLDSLRSLSVFDLACGNLRFESFLNSALPQTSIDFYAVDNCDELLPRSPSVNYQSLDILNVLLSGTTLSQRLTAPPCDLSVSFGFMHHVPLQGYREEILSSLVGQTRPGGYVIVSFWQFLKNATLAEKARITHEHALKDLGLSGLEDGDFVLGWKDIPHAYRYCHSFSEIEIDQLIESVGALATVVSRFTSDGRTDNLNTYLVLKVQD